MSPHVDLIVLVCTIGSSNAIILGTAIRMCRLVGPGDSIGLQMRTAVGTLYIPSCRGAVVVRRSCGRHPIVTLVGNVGNVRALASVAQAADASPESARLASRTPCPASSIACRHVVEAEGEVGGGYTHKVAEENVEAMVAEVVPSRRSDPDGRAERRKGNAEEVDRRGRSLAANGLDMVILLRVAHGDFAGDRRRRRRSIVPLRLLLVGRGE